MDWTRWLAESEGMKQLGQYPDPRLYNAAALLRPEERPTVPVRLFDRETDLSPYGYSKGKRSAKSILGGFTPREKDKIMISSTSSLYNDPHKLAGSLAHEQRHVLGGDENEAREEEHRVLEDFYKRGIFKDRGHIGRIKSIFSR